jgi:hypothetical protein
MRNKKISEKSEEESFNIEDHLGSILTKAIYEEEEPLEQLNDYFNENLELGGYSKSQEPLEMKSKETNINLENQNSQPKILINSKPFGSPLNENNTYKSNYYDNSNGNNFLQFSPKENLRMDKRKVQTVKYNGNFGNFGNSFYKVPNPKLLNLINPLMLNRNRSDNFNSISTNSR